MTFSRLLAAFALVTLVALAVPGDASAGHRHHRGCDHGDRYDDDRYYDRGSRYDRGSYSYGSHRYDRYRYDPYE